MYLSLTCRFLMLEGHFNHFYDSVVAFHDITYTSDGALTCLNSIKLNKCWFYFARINSNTKICRFHQVSLAKALLPCWLLQARIVSVLISASVLLSLPVRHVQHSVRSQIWHSQAFLFHHSGNTIKFLATWLQWTKNAFFRTFSQKPLPTNGTMEPCQTCIGTAQMGPSPSPETTNWT